MLKNKLLVSTSFVALIAISGCQSQSYNEYDLNYSERQKEYLGRYDGVTTHAGNQLAVNEAKMVSDPWKSRAHNTHLHGNGRRIATAVKKYELNGEEENSGGEAITIPSGALPPPPSN